jgi:hypothetical protein
LVLHAVHDTDQGKMIMSLDSSAPVTVDNYAPGRNASGVAWTSPVVSSGTHTVTVTVAEDKNPASAGRNIALDYIEARTS